MAPCAQDKNSPLPQDTPLGEVQNALHDAGGGGAKAGGAWAAKPGLEPPQQQQQYNLRGSMVENSPCLFSPMSMELTNDTLQERLAEGVVVPFDLSGHDTDSLNLNSLPPLKEGGTQNITDNVPGLSTLVEEDEEAALEATDAAAAGGLEDDDGTNMDLTGTTGGVISGVCACVSRGWGVGGAQWATRRVSCSQHAHAARGWAYQLLQPLTAHPCRAALTGLQPQHTPEHGAQQPQMPLLSPLSPLSPGRYLTRSASKASPASAQQPSAGSAGPRRRSGRRSSMSSPAAAAQPPTVSLSPLRRMTRSSMQSPLVGAALSPLAESPGVQAAVTASPASAAKRGRPGRSSRSSAGMTEVYREDTAQQQNKWGFVPGDDDTLMLDLHRGGA